MQYSYAYIALRPRHTAVMSVDVIHFIARIVVVIVVVVVKA